MLVNSERAQTPVERVIPLSSSAGTGLIPLFICISDQEWSGSADIIKTILEFLNLSIIPVSCYNLPPTTQRMRSVRIAKISLDRRNLPSAGVTEGAKIEGKPCLPTPRRCRNCWKFVHPAKYHRSHELCKFCTGNDTSGDCISTVHECSNS